MVFFTWDLWTWITVHGRELPFEFTHGRELPYMNVNLGQRRKLLTIYEVENHRAPKAYQVYNYIYILYIYIFLNIFWDLFPKCVKAEPLRLQQNTGDPKPQVLQPSWSSRWWTVSPSPVSIPNRTLRMEQLWKSGSDWVAKQTVQYCGMIEYSQTNPLLQQSSALQTNLQLQM